MLQSTLYFSEGKLTTAGCYSKKSGREEVRQWMEVREESVREWMEVRKESIAEECVPTAPHASSSWPHMNRREVDTL